MKNTLLIVLAVVVVGGLAALGYYGYRHHRHTQEVAAAAAQAAAQAAAAERERLAELARRPPPPADVRTFANAANTLPANLAAEAKGCTGGMLVDPLHQKILWSYNTEASDPVASLTKMMTVLLAVEAVDRHQGIALDTPVAITAAAAKQGGSQLWLEANSSYPLQSLLQGMMIKSANDAAYAVGETVGGMGGMTSFVRAMNIRATELNMRHTHFYNPNGLPGASADKDNRACAADIANLALQLSRHADVMTWAGTPHAPFVHSNGKTIVMDNHNRLLLAGVPGVNGLKTGYIRRSGFCIALTADRQGQPLLLVLLGFKERQTRDTFCKQMLEWGYAQLGVAGGGSVARPSVPPPDSGPARATAVSPEAGDDENEAPPAGLKPDPVPAGTRERGTKGS